MLVKQSLSDQLIIDYLHVHYGIKVVALKFLPLGADRNASVYKAGAQDKFSYFVKLKRGHHPDIGLAIVQLLQVIGIQHIIPPVKTIQGYPTQSIDDFTLIVYPFIEGQDGFTHTLTDEQWFTLGKTLRQIHEIEVPSSLKQQIKQEIYSSKWREIVRFFYAQIEAKQLGDAIALKLGAFMQKNILTIQRLRPSGTVSPNHSK